MSATDVVVLVASVILCVSVLVAGVLVAVLFTQVRRLEMELDYLREQIVPLASEARKAAWHAASELERVDNILEGTESVTSTVDTASRLAKRALSNPIVKVLAVRAGAATGLQQFRVPRNSAVRNDGQAK